MPEEKKIEEPNKCVIRMCDPVKEVARKKNGCKECIGKMDEDSDTRNLARMNYKDKEVKAKAKGELFQKRQIRFIEDNST